MQAKVTSRPEQIRVRKENGGRLPNGGLYRFPEKPYPHGILFTFYEYDYQKFVSGLKAINDKGGSGLGLVEEFTVSTKAEPRAVTGIELPFPRTLRDAQGVRIDSFERDFLIERTASTLLGIGESTGSALTNIAQVAEDLLAKVKSFGKDPIKSITEFFGNISDMDSSKAIAIGAYLARNGLAGDVARVAGALSERVVNPQDTLSFNGVNLKEFSFEWDLFPSNRQDSNNIKRIVNLLKYKMLPTVEGVGNDPVFGRAFLKYPSVVETQLLGVDASHFVKFKRAMITNIEVDYGSTGQVTIMQGGVPGAVKLVISMKELSIHTAEDYDTENSLTANSLDEPNLVVQA
jgi:hypothetical protein